MIKEYDFTIFPRKFWVILHPDSDEIKDKFLIYQISSHGYDTFTVSDYNDLIDGAEGNTIRVDDKETKQDGYLIFLFGEYKTKSDLPKLMGLITHESGHVSDFLQEDLGFRNSDTEVNAYLSGYVSSKIMEAILENENQTSE